MSEKETAPIPPLTAPAPLTDRVAELAQKLVEANPHIIKDYFVDGEPVGEQLAEAVKLMVAAPAPLTDEEITKAASELYLSDFGGKGTQAYDIALARAVLDAQAKKAQAKKAQAAQAPQQSELSEQLEAIARTWDGHLTEDSQGEEFDIGRALRSDFAKLNLAKAAPAAPVQTAELKEMEARKDAAYLERNQVVAALAKCFPSGVARTAIEGWSEDWHGCVYIDLPTGQASWHFHDSQAYLFDGLPPYAGKWDGHTAEEKYARLAALAVQAEQAQLASSQPKR
jgi:hypothetical protein